MSYNNQSIVTSLTDYTQQRQEELVTKLIWGGDTTSLPGINNVLGIKYARSINEIANTITVQAQAPGTITFTGGVSISQRSITVGKCAVYDSIPLKLLENKYFSELQKAGSPEGWEFGPALAESYIRSIHKIQDIDIWYGTTASPTHSGDSGQVNGLYTLLSSEGTRQIPTRFVTSPVQTTSSSNVLAQVNDMIAKRGTDWMMAENQYLFMDPAIFNLYTTALMAVGSYPIYQGAYGTTTQVVNKMECPIPGKNVTAKAVVGLQGTEAMILTYTGNIYLGHDGAIDTDFFEFKPDFYNRSLLLLLCEYKLGVNVAFPAQCVCNF